MFPLKYIFFSFLVKEEEEKLQGKNAVFLKMHMLECVAVQMCDCSVGGPSQQSQFFGVFPLIKCFLHNNGMLGAEDHTCVQGEYSPACEQQRDNLSVLSLCPEAGQSGDKNLAARVTMPGPECHIPHHNRKVMSSL